MQTAAAADDDTSSSGMDNPGYNGHMPATHTFSDSNTSLQSPVTSELAQQSELVRDTSIMRDDSGYRRWRRLGLGKPPDTRPGLNRLVSDMSDISNTTTSTFVSCTPSQRSDVELDERL